MNMTSGSLPAALALIVATLILLRYARNRLPLPPGPPPLPIIGNIHQVPAKHPWLKFHEWTKQYGPIFKLKLGKDTIIVLGNYETAHTLLNQRSGNFSSRPRMPMAADCLYKGLNMLLRPYGAAYRKHQRTDAPVLNTTISRKYAPIQDLESCQLVQQLLTHDDFAFQIHRYSASIAYSLVYGFRIATGREPELEATHKVQQRAMICFKPGSWAVDAIPALNILPMWLAPWKRLAQGWFEFEAALHVKNRAKALASPHWNWTKHISGLKETQDMDALELAYKSGILSDAALDTTGHTLEMFVMAAVEHPEKMRIAQDELDTVVGRQRLPDFGDVGNLPYVSALINEILRWRPILPGGVPHSNLQEDTYMGYQIPKGSIIIGPHWSIHMDEDIYGDPHIFRPERWLENPNLPNVGFGFGRRVCTGQYMARQSLFFAISRMLWGFNICRDLDEQGREIVVDSMDLTDMLLVRPMTFKARFEVRSPQTGEVITETWNSLEKHIGTILDSTRGL
jgi:cytochrome P450